MKRFTETDKWKDSWFQGLSAGVKLAYLYILDNADNAGVWDPNTRLASFQIGMEDDKIDWSGKVLKALGDRIEVLPSGKWMLTKFIRYQFGELNAECRPHQQVIKLLAMHGVKGYGKGIHRVSKPLAKGSHTLQDKDKDKDKDTDKDSGGVRANADSVYSAYPRKEARPKAIAAIAKAAERLAKAGDPEPFATLQTKTQAFAAAVSAWPKEDRQYAPHPATWFNQDRYNDDPALWRRDGSGMAATPVARPSAPSVNEPAGWREFVADDMPTCDYAPGGPKHGCAWSDVEPLHQRAIIDGMKTA